MNASARCARMPAAFWSALFVLVVNDHVLKGSGLLPAVITGKLSDFAGLVVAPLVLCALCAARSERARGLCIAVVALPFAAIKLSPWVASAVADALTALFVRSRIWCDPTDLIALAVLPWTARLARLVQPVVLGDVWPRRLAIAVAAVACTATSPAGGPYEKSFEAPLLINWTHAPIEVLITQQRARCDGSGEATSASVEYTAAIAPAHMLPLGWMNEAADAATDRDCRLVELRIAGSTFRTFWAPQAEAIIEHEVVDIAWGSRTTYETYQLTSKDDWAFERAFTVVGSARAPQLVAGARLEAKLLP